MNLGSAGTVRTGWQRIFILFSELGLAVCTCITVKVGRQGYGTVPGSGNCTDRIPAGAELSLKLSRVPVPFGSVKVPYVWVRILAYPKVRLITVPSCLFDLVYLYTVPVQLGWYGGTVYVLYGNDTSSSLHHYSCGLYVTVWYKNFGTGTISILH